MTSVQNVYSKVKKEDLLVRISKNPYLFDHSLCIHGANPGISLNITKQENSTKFDEKCRKICSNSNEDDETLVNALFGNVNVHDVRNCIKNIGNIGCCPIKTMSNKAEFHGTLPYLQFLFRGDLANLTTSYEGMYGEMRISSLRQLFKSIQSFGLDEFSTFLDIGSGRGVPNIFVAHEYNILSSIGIEKCAEAYGHSVQNIRKLIKDEFNEHNAVEKIIVNDISRTRLAFCNEDVSVYNNFNGCTHIYSFDICMESPLISKLVSSFSATETAWLWASFRKDLITKYNLKGCKVVKRLKMQMIKSGESHQCYIYLKKNWQDIARNSVKFIFENILEISKNSDGIVLCPCNDFAVSKWLQPLKVVDLIKLALVSLERKNAWYDDKFMRWTSMTRTRSNSNYKWGFSWEERKLEWRLMAEKLKKNSVKQSINNLSKKSKTMMKKGQNVDKSVKLSNYSVVDKVNTPEKCGSTETEAKPFNDALALDFNSYSISTPVKSDKTNNEKELNVEDSLYYARFTPKTRVLFKEIVCDFEGINIKTPKKKRNLK